MADNISQVEPSLRVPSVPETQRLRGSPLARGLGDVIENLDAMQNAQEVQERAQSIARVSSREDDALADIRRASKDADFEDGADFLGVAQRFDDQVGEIVTKHGTDLSPPEMALYKKRMDNARKAYRVDVQDRAFGRARQKVITDLGSELSILAGDAADAGAGEADTAIRQIAADKVKGHANEGWITPAIEKSLLDQFDSDVAANMVKRIGKDEPKLALSVLKRDGSLPALKIGQRQQLIEQMENAAALQDAKRVSQLETGIRDLSDAIEDQTVPEEETLATLEQLAKETGNDAALTAVNAARAGGEFSRQLVRLPYAEAVKLYNETAKDTAGPASERQAKSALGLGTLREMEAKLTDDPLSFVMEKKVADVPPLDLSGDPRAFAARAQLARAVARHYGVQPKFFTEDEREAFSDRLAQADPQAKLTMLSQMTGAFGGDALAALSEISKNAPVEAHLGMVATIAPGRDKTALLGFAGQKALKEKTVKLPSEDKLAAVETQTFGNARLGGSRNAIIAAGRAIYAGELAERGEGEFDPQGYASALNRAVAGLNGKGGFVTRNGSKVILPPDMDSADLDAALRAADDSDLVTMSVGGGAPVHMTLSGKTVKATPEEIRAGALVQAADGSYFISTADPATGEQRLLLDDKSGRYYQLDLGNPAKRPAPLQTVRTLAPMVLGPFVIPVPSSVEVKQTQLKPAKRAKDQSRVPVE